ncbi:MAG: anaerobic ribonucleoside-triphosphate reductase activating protein [Clostridia bacterium]|nr:anaerobic ribonucleoside-triphosphate reductase activating protein [Clostridia bacterium]
MNYALIRKNDIANGTGVRVSLFVSGCRHRCKGCFNREAWNFDYGKPFGEAEIEEILSACDRPYIEGLSLLGGEPFEPENRSELIRLCRRFRERFPDKTVWCYTGFTLETELLAEDRAETDGGKKNSCNEERKNALELLSLIDVLVDGRFIEELKSPALLFRGSSNQRIIDVKATLATGITTWLPGKWERSMGTGNIYEG